MANALQIFLAHASEDKEQVRKLYQRINSEGFRPWLDEFDLMPGQNWQIEIPNAIRKSHVFIACLSKLSVKKQGYVQKEFRLALSTYAEKPEGSIYLIPLRLDDCEVPNLQIPELGVNLRHIQWLDYWKPDGFELLIKTVQDLSTKVETASSSKSHNSDLIIRQAFDLPKFKELTDYAFSSEGLGIYNKMKAAEWTEERLEFFSKHSFDTFKELVQYAFGSEGLGMYNKMKAAEWAEERLEFFSKHSFDTFKELVQYAFGSEGLGMYNKMKAAEWAFEKIQK